MSRFLEQIRKAKEARESAAAGVESGVSAQGGAVSQSFSSQQEEEKVEEAPLVPSQEFKLAETPSQSSEPDLVASLFPEIALPVSPQRSNQETSAKELAGMATDDIAASFPGQISEHDQAPDSGQAFPPRQSAESVSAFPPPQGTLPEEAPEPVLAKPAGFVSAAASGGAHLPPAASVPAPSVTVEEISPASISANPGSMKAKEITPIPLAPHAADMLVDSPGEAFSAEKNPRGQEEPVHAPLSSGPHPLPDKPLFPEELVQESAPTPPPAKPRPPIVPRTEKKDATPAGHQRLTPRRSKSEIPIPGPEPDPASVQRIAVAYPKPNNNVLSFYEPKHHICEEYRLLGKNLLHTFANMGETSKRGKVIILTSSIRGEGKTLTGLNLALTMSYDLKDRILLIDGDMRHPMVHRYFGLPSKAGLNNMLTAPDPRAILEDCIVRTESGLHCMLSQATRDNPAPLLDGPRMTEILEMLRDRYSIIIVDTPPVLLATDALALGTRSDGVLFILRARKTKREQIQEARQRIARLEIRMLGYVINHVKSFLPKIWSRYNYGNYHYY